MRRYALLLLLLMAAAAHTVQAQDAPRPSDADILQIFMTMNQGEIVTSEPAREGVSEEAQRFAQMMIEHHSGVIERAQAMAQTANLTPKPNMVSQSLTAVAQGIAGRLSGLQGDAKTREYVTSQVALHAHGLDMLDFVLIPNAQNAQLKALLTEARPTVAQHLDQARTMLAGMK